MLTKRASIITMISILAIVGLNVYYYYDTYNWQVNTQKSILQKELLICGQQIEETLHRTQTNLVLLITPNELDTLFEKQARAHEVQRRMEMLFNRYDAYLQSFKIVRVRDGQTYTLKRNPNESYTYYFDKQVVRDAFNHNQIIDARGETLTYVQPLYSDLKIFGYVEMVFDVKDFFRSSFYSFSLGDLQFQWVLRYNGTVLYNTLEQEAFYPRVDSRELINRKAGVFSRMHSISIAGEQVKVLSLFLHSRLSEPGYFLVFSLPLSLLSGAIVKNASMVGVISLLIIIMIIGFYGTMLRNQQKREQRLRLSEQALNRMLQYLPVGIVLLDQHGEVRQINKAAMKLFGLEDEDVIVGQTLERDKLFLNYEVVSTSSFSSFDNRFVLRDKAGKEYVITNEKIPFFMQNERYLIDFYHEITPFITLRDENKQTPQAEFIANISHELRTPLNGIIGMNELLASSENLPREEHEMAQLACRSAEILLSLINDILDFSKIEAGRFEIESIPFNLSHEIESTIESFKPVVRERKIDLSWHASTRLPNDFMGDPIRLRQIINNLIGNAIKFTPQGSVHFGIHESRMLNGNRALLFSVKDTGIGIKKSKLKTIFKPFLQADQTTTRKFGGTGLGTTISKQLVNLMGGEIWANSPSGLSDNPEFPGSEFCFTLPYKTRKYFKELHLENVFTFSQVKVALITDDALQVKLMIKNLAGLKVNYDVLPPIRETLNKLEDAERYHFLIIDHRPDLNGLDFLMQLHNHQLHLRYLIAIQSSDFQSSNTSMARRLGADVYLRKPVNGRMIQNFILRHFPSIVPDTHPGSLPVPASLQILVLEDDTLNQQLMKNIFKRLGYSIDLAADKTEALALFEDKEYHLICVNFDLTEVDGLMLAKLLRERGYKKPIIMMANHELGDEELKAYKGVVDDFMIKPPGLDKMLQIIVKWYGTRNKKLSAFLK